MMHKSDSVSSQHNFNPAIVSGVREVQPQEIELDDLPVGTVLEIQTGHTTYRLENMGSGNVMISGHPQYCPTPTSVHIHGCIGENGNLRWHHIGKGLHMVFLPPDHGIVRTSRIKEIHTVTPPARSN